MIDWGDAVWAAYLGPTRNRETLPALLASVCWFSVIGLWLGTLVQIPFIISEVRRLWKR